MLTIDQDLAKERELEPLSEKGLRNNSLYTLIDGSLSNEEPVN